MTYRPDPAIWSKGYSGAELDDAQGRYGLRFPPDLVDLLRESRLTDGYDWRGPEGPIRAALAWPLEGLLFDVEENSLWWPEWGDRPNHPGERAEIVAAQVAQAPKLIPLIGHRYLPDAPSEAGNPVLSVYQSDIIIYGHNLHDYILSEFYPGKPRSYGPIRSIAFWSKFLA